MLLSGINPPVGNMHPIQDREPDCILSGGAAHQLQPHLKVNTTIADNLVLEGLALIAQEIPEAQP